MDVSFIWEREKKRHSIEFDSEYALLTRFINEECNVAERGDEILNTFINQLAKEQDVEMRFSEWTLELESEDAVLTRNTHSNSQGFELEEGMSLVEQQLTFGRVDLLQALESWQNFIAKEVG